MNRLLGLVLILSCFSCGEDCKTCTYEEYSNRLSQLENREDEFTYTHTPIVQEFCGDELEEIENNEVGRDIDAGELEETYTYLDSTDGNFKQDIFKYRLIRRVTCE